MKAKGQKKADPIKALAKAYHAAPHRPASAPEPSFWASLREANIKRATELPELRHNPAPRILIEEDMEKWDEQDRMTSAGRGELAERSEAPSGVPEAMATVLSHEVKIRAKDHPIRVTVDGSVPDKDHGQLIEKGQEATIRVGEGRSPEPPVGSHHEATTGQPSRRVKPNARVRVNTSVNTTALTPAQPAVAGAPALTPSKSRAKDRHSPDYMRRYMIRWRAARKLREQSACHEGVARENKDK